ncbi:MAG: MBL fold metallo-hydrolase [Anaerolineaceae bacterium]|nr:MBL fold metallo-hydrolase [Anaerolineaceae bacterium]
MDKGVQLTYGGTNCLLFRKGESALLVDPHFTRPAFFSLLGEIRPSAERIRDGLAGLGAQDLAGVLLTHTHYDHALDAVETASQTGAPLFGSPSAGQLAAGAGLSPNLFHEVHHGDAIQVGDFSVRFLPSEHIRFPAPLSRLVSSADPIPQPLMPPAWFWQYRCGQVSAILVDRTLIFGSAAFVAGAYRGWEVETVVLGIGGLGLRPLSYLETLYRETVVASGARQVLISHWDNFFQPSQTDLRPLGRVNWTVNHLKALANRYGQTIFQLAYNHPVDLTALP